jgi:hypothetical protein
MQVVGALSAGVVAGVRCPDTDQASAAEVLHC